MTGVATRWLARADADELAQIGTGKQARTQVAAVAAVRPPATRSRVQPDRGAPRGVRARLARRGLGFEVEGLRSLDRALEGAPIVTIATRAREPFVARAALARGAHVNAIGAITPSARELARDVSRAPRSRRRAQAARGSRPS